LTANSPGFVDVVRADIDFSNSPKDLLRMPCCPFLNYIDTNRASGSCWYTQPPSSQAFATLLREGRDWIVEHGRQAGCGLGREIPSPTQTSTWMAVALVGAARPWPPGEHRPMPTSMMRRADESTCSGVA